MVFISCQDTKSKKDPVQKEAKNQKKATAPTTDETAASQKDLFQKKLESIQKVGQKQLIPFLKDYGKANPETHVRISTKYGDIEVKLFKDTPLHRANFIRLVKLGYFNTTYFHRVDEDFVIQGGNSDDDKTTRMRRAIGSYLIPKEFNKKHLHDRGAFSAAKYSKQNVSKASSPYEFFIVLGKNGAHHLDFDHTVFGQVIKGMDVVEKISEVKTDSREWPLNNIYIKAKVLDWGG